MTPPADAPPRWEWLGPDDADVRVAGHSHMLTLRESMDRLGQDRRRVAVLDVAEAPVVPTDSYWDTVAADDRPVVVVWGGNEHAVVFMLSDEPITIIGPRGEVPDAPRRVIPYTMVKSLWRIWLTPLAQFLERHPSPGAVTLLGTPPPKPEDRIRAGIAVEPHFVALLGKQGLTPASAPVVATATRVASWNALQDTIHEIALEGGASFLPVPDDIASADGTLRPELCSPDATHANADYGHRMWRHLLEQYAGSGS